MIRADGKGSSAVLLGLIIRNRFPSGDTSLHAAQPFLTP